MTGRPRSAGRLVLFAAAAFACGGTLPPLRGHMEVGRDPYAIFVGGGSALGGDLYAVRTDGGAVVQVTFTPVGEMRPALSPDGVKVAFLRSASLRDSTPGSVWLMNLLSGGEREVGLPAGAGPPKRVAWAPGGRSLVIETSTGLFSAAAPPAAANAQPVPPDGRASAESTLAVRLGDPVFAEVVPCADRAALCVQADTGTPGLLAEAAHDPLRWGADSVAFFRGDRVEVRPVGPGRPRRLMWAAAPRDPREMTVFLGRPDRAGEPVRP